MSKFQMRIYHAERGGHTHLRIFVGLEGSMSFGCAGTLTMRNEEFEAWRCNRLGVEFLEDIRNMSSQEQQP